MSIFYNKKENRKTVKKNQEKIIELVMKMRKTANWYEPCGHHSKWAKA
jgi:hypothetical protein